MSIYRVQCKYSVNQPGLTLDLPPNMIRALTGLMSEADRMLLKCALQHCHTALDTRADNPPNRNSLDIYDQLCGQDVAFLAGHTLPSDATIAKSWATEIESWEGDSEWGLRLAQETLPRIW